LRESWIGTSTIPRAQTLHSSSLWLLSSLLSLCNKTPTPTPPPPGGNYIILYPNLGFRCCALPVRWRSTILFFSLCFHMVFDNSSLFMSMLNLI
jgi:hypothetical protein